MVGDRHVRSLYFFAETLRAVNRRRQRIQKYILRPFKALLIKTKFEIVVSHSSKMYFFCLLWQCTFVGFVCIRKQCHLSLYTLSESCTINGTKTKVLQLHVGRLTSQISNYLPCYRTAAATFSSKRIMLLWQLFLFL